MPFIPYLAAAALFAASLTAAGKAQAETVFHCGTANGKQIRLDYNAADDMLTYSFGSNPHRPDITLQSPVSRATGGWRNHSAIGVYINRVGLSNGNTTYYVEDSRDDGGRLHQGVSVERGGKVLSFIPCRSRVSSNLFDISPRVIDTL